MRRPQARWLRWLWFRPTTWRQVLAYSVAMLALGLGIGLLAGRHAGWVGTAVALSVGILLAGLLRVAGQPDAEIPSNRHAHKQQ